LPTLKVAARPEATDFVERKYKAGEKNQVHHPQPWQETESQVVSKA
jgi:hypothetical protein